MRQNNKLEHGFFSIKTQRALRLKTTAKMMAEFLLELFGEETPARMQAMAAQSLRTLVTNALVAHTVLYEDAKAYVTPRRLTLHIVGLPTMQKATVEEKIGPRVDAAEAAIAGFLKSHGLADVGGLEQREEPKKGKVFVYKKRVAGRPVADVLGALLPEAIKAIPWPKTMRWGAESGKSGAFTWVRPLHGVLASFGSAEDGYEVVPFVLGSLQSGKITHGHRFMAPKPFAVQGFADYRQKLHAAWVELDGARRADIIMADAKNLAHAQNLELVEDKGLLDEVIGLVEWPVVLLGRFDEKFLTLPDAVIRATIRANQKCFVARNPATGRLANAFIITANLLARDGGLAIIAGNERVVRARLSDALHFFETDQKPLADFAHLAPTPLEQRLAKLQAQNIIFHAKIGTQGARVARVETLAMMIWERTPYRAAVSDHHVTRAARLAKADLMSEMVGEFPELQGLMGRLYAKAQGEPEEVCAAIEEHYKPQGPSDGVPTAPVSVILALADKLDALAQFWRAGEIPTGSRDPFGLRRAALGIIRIVLDNEIAKFDIPDVLRDVLSADANKSLFNFILERLKIHLRDADNLRPDVLEAAFAASVQATYHHDLQAMRMGAKALQAFLDTPDGTNIVQGYKRAANILKVEEKKDGRAFSFDGLNAALLEADEEKILSLHVKNITTSPADKIEDQVRELAAKRPYIDAFFDNILVNDPRATVRHNRLCLLKGLTAAMEKIAAFDKLQG